MISTHAPAGGATYTGLNDFRQKLHFYSRPCGRGDCTIPALIKMYGLFLLTPLREGRHVAIEMIAGMGIFLLTPLREGRLLALAQMVSLEAISTHAPAGGATLMAELTEVSVRFLLTPLREGRPRRFPAARQRTHFYSRPCGRGDVTYIDDAKVMELISTHAPAGGATYGFEVTLFDEDYYFYSRPCGRGDQKPEVRTIRRYISTHAPAGGATRVCHHRCRQNDNFYSRPCGRGDNEINIGQRHGSQFLLTPLREGRQVLKRLVRIGTVFLLTPLREGRPRRR